MKRPTFNENTEVKIISHDCYEYGYENGVERKTDMYGWRGRVVKITGLKDHPELAGTGKRYEEVASPYTPENYPDVWWVDVKFKSPIDGFEYTSTFMNWENELKPVQHKFVDIDYLREEAIVLGTKPDGTQHIRPANTGAFEVGDKIQITTKVDGSNASISWDETTNKLEVFSRTNLLTSPGSLHGFYDYIKTVVEPKIADFLKTAPQYVIFGEWLTKHTVNYNKEAYNKWYVYDIYHKGMDRYLPQCAVKDFCEKHGLEYVEVLYEGPFISWEHCRSFIGKSTVYGPQQEGVVVKNQTKIIDNSGVRDPVYIKIVDEKFKEAQHSNKPPKVVDPEKVAAHEKAVELVEAVVTEARVKKIICKLIDEDKLPTELRPTDMGAVMKLLPKCAFDDIIKEEIETANAVRDLGENIGKLVASTAAKHARTIIVGK